MHMTVVLAYSSDHATYYTQSYHATTHPTIEQVPPTYCIIYAHGVYQPLHGVHLPMCVVYVYAHCV